MIRMPRRGVAGKAAAKGDVAGAGEAPDLELGLASGEETKAAASTTAGGGDTATAAAGIESEATAAARTAGPPPEDSTMWTRPDPQFSYASLNEHLLRHSLRHARKEGDWQRAIVLLFGWALQLLAFGMMLFTFSLYGCMFASVGDATTDQALVLSWGWSIFQRFLINEPGMIMLARYLPILLASEGCANVCGEGFAAGVGIVFEAVSTACKALSAR